MITSLRPPTRTADRRVAFGEAIDQLAAFDSNLPRDVCAELQNQRRAARRMHESPRLDVLSEREHFELLTQENHVDRKAHPTRMDTAARHEQQAFVLVDALSTEQSDEALHESAGHGHMLDRASRRDDDDLRRATPFFE